MNAMQKELALGRWRRALILGPFLLMSVGPARSGDFAGQLDVTIGVMALLCLRRERGRCAVVLREERGRPLI